MPTVTPKKRTKLRLKSKVSLAIVLTIIVLGLMATITTYYISRQVLVDTQKANLLNTTVIQSHETAQVFTQSQNLVKSVATQHNIVGLLSNTDSEMDIEHVITHGLLEDYNIGGAYSSIYLINAQGLTILSTDKSFEGKNYGFRDYFKKALSGQPYVDVSIGVTSQQLGYYFSHPIISTTNEVIGVAVVKLIPSFVADTLIGEAGVGVETMLVDEYGVVVHSSEEEKIYHSLGIISEVATEEISEKKRYANLDIQALSYSDLQDIVLDYKEPTIITLFDKHDNKEEVLSISKIGNLPFYVVTEVETSQAVQFATKTALSLAVFVLIAATVAALVISVLISRFLKPLTKLQQATENISKGDFNQKVVITSGDELEDFATTLNTMIVNIKEARSNIEQKVADRTQELERLNQTMTGRELKMIELKKEIKDLRSNSNKNK